MSSLIFMLQLSVSFSSLAQTDSLINDSYKLWKNTSIEAIYQNGYIFSTNDFLKGSNAEADRINAFQAFSIKISTQTTGERLWEQIYKYPNWGFGAYVAGFHNPEEIGVPIALYSFFNAPFKRWERFTFNYEIGFGASFNWKSFDPINNKYNVSIGAGQSFLIDAGLNLQYQLTDKIDISGGFSLTHFSNGALKMPNNGLNTIAPKIGLKYNFYKDIHYAQQEVPVYNKENEWLISVFGGAKNVVFDTLNIDIIEKYEGVFFPVFGISTAYNRQISYKSKIGFGFNVAYNGTVNTQVAIDNGELEAIEGPFKEKIQLSIYPSYELVIHRMSLILQPAFYIYRTKLKNQSPVFHQRIGLKYHVSDNFFVGITLRDYEFHVSDFIEWTLGYRLKWN